jgi:hypothetical protein
VLVLNCFKAIPKLLIHIYSKTKKSHKLKMPQKVKHYLGHFYEKKLKYNYAFKIKCIELVLKTGN